MWELERNKDKCCSNEKEIDSSLSFQNPNRHWIVGEIYTPICKVLQVSTKLTIFDTIYSWKVRWGINRMNYKVDPGIYCIGNPDDKSPVLVTANYKMSFDMLRKELSDKDAWILVLDTKGVNVWCAAGKGTFGTDELVSKIKSTRLLELVSHRTIILPQLGAPGISAHEVYKRTGFKVIYGPVRASDIKEFLKNNLVATPQMRKVNFNIFDRLILTPIEIVNLIKPSIYIISTAFSLNLLTNTFFSIELFSVIDLCGYIGALTIGCIIVPLLLPWIPGKSFAFKGWLLGLSWVLLLLAVNNSMMGILRQLSYMLIFPSLSAFVAVNFTGSSTYTSFSGVMKEMKIAIPSIAISMVVGIFLLILGSIV
ncbi:mercury methylation corrinoid protein HgcA [Serpentinicella alkaliphila]|uniref:CO dehydrogenase/acetyl-CoA synthase delta subunit n=1 Tax=Serpentinicella alkaliphila TaxID=1734049 RepID=A0A4R2TPK8_9FIRM|nr:mercury methylation corrinoid protein HgcA [Serpentinicella alkaliphila]QUH26485.1 acetyl-CoA synthase subunit gamma [Serpentinicella alkaliphila]TCQ03235.1 CO dehydrogenase/acetyl-CoA synthase delta subunit [Serpentinicella alkaliphila]